MHKPLYFSIDNTKRVVFIRVNIYLPGVPFNISDDQVHISKYIPVGITHHISKMNTILLSIQQHSVKKKITLINYMHLTIQLNSDSNFYTNHKGTMVIEIFEKCFIFAFHANLPGDP